MGKPAPAAAVGDPPKRRAASTRRTREQRFPKNLKLMAHHCQEIRFRGWRA